MVRTDTTICVERETKDELEKLRKDRKWDGFLIDLKNKALQYDREKPSMDAKSHEYSQEILRLRELQAELKLKFESDDWKKEELLRVENELQRAKKELDHLREILNLRAS